MPDLSVCATPGRTVHWRFWPGAEDKALRGRNLSAVFRTLYRQVGKLLKGFPSCAQTWRVENQSDKSTLQKPTQPWLPDGMKLPKNHFGTSKKWSTDPSLAKKTRPMPNAEVEFFGELLWVEFLYILVAPAKNLSFSRSLNYQLNSTTPCLFFTGKPTFPKASWRFFDQF
jgi:hypothetical protein